MLATQESELMLDKDQLKVLASDTRLEILKLLASRNHSISELAARLGHSKSTIHEHISRLVEAGLIERVNSGYANKWVYYRLTRRGMQLFDKSRKIVVIIASFFVILAVSQLIFLFLQSAQFPKLQESTPISEEISQATRTGIVSKSSNEVVKEGESSEQMPVHEAEQAFRVDLLIYSSSACLAIALVLFIYYKSSASRIILKRKR